MIKFKKTNIFFFFIFFILSNKLITSKIYQENPNDMYYKEYLQRISNKRSSNKRRIDEQNNIPNDNKYYYNNEFTEKPTSSFDFLYKGFINKLLAFFHSYDDYFDGLKYVLSKYKYLFRRFSSEKIINKTITNTAKPKFEKYFTNNEENKFKFARHLDEKISKNKKNKKIKQQNYEFNNTDLYNTTTCPSSPDLKVNYYYYFCNGEKVSKEIYEEKISQGEKCEFYNNTQKICFCPINYINCYLRSQSRIRCMAKEVIVNNEINLTQYYDTFYEEFFKTPILDNENKIFDFSVKLKCGMPISDEVTGGKNNFYLSSDNDTSDFDIIKTIYRDDDDIEIDGKQYSKEELKNREINILKYFIKKKNLVMFMKPQLSLKFSLIDQQWILPYRIKTYDIDKYLVEDLLSGEKSFNFTVDLNDIIENELGVGPFSKKIISYPYFDKGDIHFFEFDIEEKEKQMRFYPVRGEIKK